MKVLVVGVFLESDLIERYNKISTHDAKISIASVKYTKLINAGFEECLRENTEQIFLAPIGMYPQCKVLTWNRRNIDGIKYLKFVNIIFLKQLTISLDLLLMIFKWNRKNRNEKKFIVFTSVYLPFLFSIIPFKYFGNIKFVSFIPDLPTYSFSYSANGGFLKGKFTSLYIYLANKLNLLIDYYVFITKYMGDIYPDKPFTIIEGLADLKTSQEKPIQKSFPKVIMYSGALFQKFGVKNLVDAFTQIKGDYELWLFGSGDMITEINDYALKDKRIKYYGNQPHSLVLDYQKRATLLINPRFSHEEFTKFSFPSKLIEYLSSGTPILTTRLLGIPDDYQDKFYFIEDESVSGFKKEIENCLKKSSEELISFGNNGKKFVLTEKNYTLQIKKLVKNLNKYFKSIFISLFLSGFSLYSCMISSVPEIKMESTVQQKNVINVQQFKVFPVNGSKETDDFKYERWLNIKKAFEYCIQNKYDLYFPKGVYDVGARNFPFRKEDIQNMQLRDCKSITIFGDGRGTVLKTSSELGADVLQLNFMKNLTLKNFDITAEISSTKRSGSNGISITNGFDNIVLDNIYIYDLPGIDKGNYIDGGKGLTLQFDPNLNSVKGNLRATNIKVKNCAYGFRFDAVSVSDLLKENINIKIQMEADRTFQGFSMAFGAPTENVKPTAKLNMEVDAVLTNSQQYVAFSRVIGGSYRFTLDKTIDNIYIKKDEKNKVWYKADQLCFAFLSNYSKNTNTTIIGNVGKVDTKIWMGAVGSVVEPFNLKNRTEYNVFDFDIVGTSSDEDFKIIDYNGNSINNSEIILSPKTVKNQTDLKKISNKNNSLILK